MAEVESLLYFLLYYIYLFVVVELLGILQIMILNTKHLHW